MKIIKKVLLNKSQGTSTAIKIRLDIPKDWANEMGIDENNKEVILEFNETKKEIKITKST